MSNAIREEHPADKKMRLKGQRDGKKYGPAFAKKHEKQLAKLISTYADSEAEELLWKLREKFWYRSYP